MILPLDALGPDRPQPRPVYDNPRAIARRRGWLGRLALGRASGRASVRPAPPAERLPAAG
jgi:hypothetical protein